MNIRIIKYAGPLIALFLFTAALLILHHELKIYHYHDVVAAFRALPVIKIVYAAALTLLSYTAMASYDIMAIRYIRNPLSYLRTVFASMVSYALSNNIGMSILSASAARYRIYSVWGLMATEVTKILVFVITTFWLGFFTVGGFVLLSEPVAIPRGIHLPFSSVLPLGILFTIIVCAYFMSCALKKNPLKIKGLELTVPSPGLALSQIVISSIDWLLASSVLYVLLPPIPSLSFEQFLGIYLLAQLTGMISHVPGGLGVFETVVILFLSAEIPASSVMGSLLAYRVVYYLLPLTAAIIMLGMHETIIAREKVKRTADFIGRWISLIIPHVFAITTFMGGAILLLSGATPSVKGRMEFLKDVLPLPVLEVSHFLGSLAGVGLVLLARGIQRRLDAAYFTTLVLLVSGAAFSLLKGLDYEEAVILISMFSLLLPCRKYFYRKASLFSESLTQGWITAITLILVTSVWIGIFSYKHVEYSGDLWWHFAFYGDAPRFLRASVGTAVLLLLFLIAKLFRPHQPMPSLPEWFDLEKAKSIASSSIHTYAYISLLGDKSLLFSASERSFIMYGIEGRSWVAMGDPVGAEDDNEELIWKFRELSDRYDGWSVFYEIGEENLHYYADLGLSFIKLGEDGRVRLETFSLEGGRHRQMRHILHKLEREGCSFEIIQPGEVLKFLNRFRMISDAWLMDKHTREKGFSLGYFNENYLMLFPAAIVKKGDDIIAFANIWPGAEKEELTIDLMRYHPDAPNGVMDYLFVNLMQWGKLEGYRWFDLGMAPLSGLDKHAAASTWNRIGGLLYRHGEHFYNFQGLRQYKEKFDPEWRPKYLAYPGIFTLPRVSADIAALISGGLKGIITK